MNQILAKGVYSLADVARLTGYNYNRVRHWFFDSHRVFHGDYERLGREFAVSFFDLIDVYVAGELREKGAPLREVRRAFEQLKQDLQTGHPFCHRDLFVENGRIFFHAVEKAQANELYHVVSGQHFIREVMLPHLKSIDYDKVTHMAEAWHLAKGVVIRAGVNLGRPMAAGTGVATGVLFNAWQANGRDTAFVAELYGVSPNNVMNSVDFELSLKRPAAA